MMMPTAVTQGIRVSVRTQYLPNESRPQHRHYVFAYSIEIKNESDVIVQLLSREWRICDGMGGKTVVKGDGVIGRQPIIAPNDSYRYVSGTHFTTAIGCMSGLYMMRRFSDNELIEIEIPTFVMATPAILN